MQFANRKEQIEKGFLPRILRALRAEGFDVSRKRKLRAVIKDELKGAAMVGAAEERGRNLCIIRPIDETRNVEQEIISRSVLDVLGYKD